MAMKRKPKFEWVEYDGYICATTDLAIGLCGRIVYEEGDQDVEIWLPKSQVGLITYANGGDEPSAQRGRLIEALQMPKWIARQNGLL